MSRLVDIDEVIKVAENTFPQEDMRKIMWVLCHAPTAYDIEKVVAELESKKGYELINNRYGESIGAREITLINIDKAIDIVRKG